MYKATLFILLMLTSALALSQPLVKTVKSGEVTAHGKGSPGFVSVDAETSKLSGTATIADDGSVTGTFVVKMVDIDAGIRTGHMKDLLEVEKYPEVKLAITSYSASETASDFAGDFTFHGVTKPVTGKAWVKGGKLWAAFSFPYSAYGVAPLSKFGITVADKIDIEVKAEIE